MYAPNRYREEIGLGGIAVYINESRIKICFVSDSITYVSEKGRERLVPTQNECVERELRYRKRRKLGKWELVLRKVWLGRLI